MYYAKPGDVFCSGKDCMDKYMVPGCTCPPDSVIKHMGKIGCKPQSPRKKICFKDSNARLNNGG